MNRPQYSVSKSICCVLLSISIVLTGCIADENNTIYDLRSKEDIIVENSIESSSNILNEFKCARLGNIAAEDYIYAFSKVGTCSTGLMPLLCNTPEKVFFLHSNKETYETNIYVWDKKTGTITFACPDPLCDHSNCIFNAGELRFIFANTNELILCRLSEDGRYGIYSVNYDRWNAKKIFETNDTISPLSFSLDSNDLYLTLPFKVQNGETVYRICEISNGKAIPISPAKDDIESFAATDNGIYYMISGKSELMYTNDRFTTITLYAENVRTFYACNQCVLINTIDGKVYDGETFIMDYPGIYDYCDGWLYYQTFDGKLFRKNISSGIEEHVLDFMTDGVKDQYEDYIVDSLGLIYTISSSYKDIEAAERPSLAQTHFTIYDIITGDKILIDPSNGE